MIEEKHDINDYFYSNKHIILLTFLYTPSQ